MTSTTEAPVLFITFNRTDTTRVVFETIRKAKPKKLYMFSDGPRANRHEDDWSKISENRQLANEVDWDCTVYTRFLEKNQGCGEGVSGAISWAFEQEDRLIILEDDCVPALSFFSLCNELLQKYLHNPRVMHISGTRWNEEFPMNDGDYFFMRYAHIWGWATWKRAWDLYDYQMKDWPQFKEKKILNIVEKDYAPMIKSWNFLFTNIYNLERKHTWDYQWQYCIFKHDGLCINAVQNQITNIGAEGMHSSEVSHHHNRERHEISTPLREPQFMHPPYGFELYHANSFFLNNRSKLKLLYDHASSRFPFLSRQQF